MNDSRLNIKFNYLYRDAGNYKKFGSVIFTNPNNIPTAFVDETIRQFLIDHEFFDHEIFEIPSLFYEMQNNDDHNWHEYENVASTDEKSTNKNTIDKFTKNISDKVFRYKRPFLI